MIHGLRFLLVTAATFLLCLSLHELGHAIAGCITGGMITEIAIFSLPPHVRIAGDAGTAGEMFRSAGGSGFFLLLYFVACIIVRPWNVVSRQVREMASWFAAIEVGGWVLASMVKPDAFGPNDAERFLAVSGMHPASLAAVCVFIGAAGALALYAARERRPFQPVEAPPLTRHAAAG